MLGRIFLKFSPYDRGVQLNLYVFHLDECDLHAPHRHVPIHDRMQTDMGFDPLAQEFVERRFAYDEAEHSLRQL